MRHVLGQLRRYLLGIAPAETTFARRGFAPCAEPVQARLERVGATFLRGYHSALYDDRPEVLSIELDRIDPEMRGFAYEGAAMVLALLDRLSPWRKSRVKTFLAGAGAAHAYMVHVGVGWAFARVGRRIERWLERRDPLLRWLVVDGYGFHEGYFHGPRAIDDQVCPRRLVGYARRAFDQGLGRSLWFVRGADADRIQGTIGDFAPERRADLWSGIGLASAYAGGVDRTSLEAVFAATGDHAPALAQGAAFAAKARQRAGNLTAHTRMATDVYTGLDAEQAAELTDQALALCLSSMDGWPTSSEVGNTNSAPEFASPTAKAMGHPTPLSIRDEAEPAYELWRTRVRNHFVREAVSA